MHSAIITLACWTQGFGFTPVLACSCVNMRLAILDSTCHILTVREVSASWCVMKSPVWQCLVLLLPGLPAVDSKGDESCWMDGVSWETCCAPAELLDASGTFLDVRGCLCPLWSRP